MEVDEHVCFVFRHYHQKKENHLMPRPRGRNKIGDMDLNLTKWIVQDSIFL
jgi:hypothetical protein